MIYRDNSDLIIIETKTINKSISISSLIKKIDKLAYNIYFTYLNKVYGLIKIDDLYNSIKSDKKRINIKTEFVYNGSKNIIELKNKFKKLLEDNNEINEIPIIDNDTLCGAYFIGTGIDCIKQIYSYNRYLNYKQYEFEEEIIFIKKSNNNLDDYSFFKDFFQQQNYNVLFTSYEDFLNSNLNYNQIVIFESESDLKNYSIISKIKNKVFYDSRFFSLYSFFERADGLETSFLVSKYLTSFFLNLENQGVNVFNIFFDHTEPVFEDFQNAIKNKYLEKNMFVNNSILNPKEFFCELYSKDYHDKIIEMRDHHFGNKHIAGANYLKDYKSKYLNITNSIRRTCYQITNPDFNMHMYGPCFCIGTYVEDKYTIESLLQKKFVDNNININIHNHGALNNTLGYIEMISNTKLYSGDTVVFFGLYFPVYEIYNINLNEVIEKNYISLDWVVDSIFHCNHIVDEIISEKLFNNILPCLSFPEERKEIKNENNVSINVYLEKYFSNNDYSSYNKVGAIVMNCNPFTKGHRYLIEEALKQVDYLFVFVLSEDLSLFSFTERFSIVLKNLSDLNNIYVVPSGDMILSQKTFPEYFVKKVDEDIYDNMRYDLETFANVIASRLNIKYRFVGEEPIDKVTLAYNNMMKEILPEYGIELIEIPRKKRSNKCIAC